jgi:hypothetical protein
MSESHGVKPRGGVVQAVFRTACTMNGRGHAPKIPGEGTLVWASVPE